MGAEPDLVLDEARQAGVLDFVLPAISPTHWPRAQALAAAHPDVHLALGVHPRALRDLDDRALDEALERLPALLVETGAVAIGEVGLDHAWERDPLLRERQASAFVRQLQIAAELGLPPLIHCVKAHGALLELWRASPCHGALPGVLHAYTGSAPMVTPYTDAGLFISLAGPITWPGARKPASACLAVPEDRLLLETDAPYQAPHPHRGAPNSPARLRLIAARVAEVRGMEVEAVARLTTENARALFRTRP